ncbi:MAG: stage III sporulation protein AB [Candidatus Improbicoccus devescovinae]|nr:MAG: stage III sporulation protein AB [Candidatus Improbicoccus devescovinae]
MIKLVGASLLMCTGTLISKIYVQKLKNKILILDLFKEFLIYTKQEINFNLTPPDIILKNYLIKFKSNFDFEFYNYIKKCSENMQTGKKFPESWKISFCYIIKKMDFCTEILNIFEKFGAEFGTTNAEHQINLCDFIINKLEYYNKIFRKDYEKNSKLYLTLGMCLGALVAVLLI